jgi:hypothetical protein
MGDDDATAKGLTSAPIKAGYRKCIYVFFRFEASYTWYIGWHRLESTCTAVPCVNKTQGSPFMLSIRHISHSMLGHNVAVSCLAWKNRKCIYSFLPGVLESS